MHNCADKSLLHDTSNCRTAHWNWKQSDSILGKCMRGAGTYVTPSHKTSLNSRLADKCYQLNSRWGSIWVIFTLLQKCILETLNYDVVVIFCSINDIKVLKPLLRKMCKSTKTHNTKTFKAIFSKWPPAQSSTLNGYNLYNFWPTTFIYRPF